MKKVYFIIPNLLLFSVAISFSQGYGELSLPGNAGSVCPKIKTTYYISPDVESTQCASYVTVTNGSFSPDQVQTTKNLAAGVYTFDVYWNDNTSWGRITVGATCDGPNFSINEKYAIKSVVGKNIANAKVVTSPDYCSTSGITISVDKLKIPNTETTDVPIPEYADGYEWQLPSGWKRGLQSGTVYSSSNSISITPDDGCITGIVTVRAYVGCSGTKSFSNSATIDLKRADIPLALTVPAGYNGQDCSTAPVTFTAENLSCASSYTWSSEGSGWSAPNNNWVTSTNQIALTPSSTGDNAGDISVSINLGCGSPIVQTYNVTQLTSAPPSPGISHNHPNSEICSGETFTFTLIPPEGYPSNYGFDFYTSSSGVLINNTTTSVNSPYHTTSNSVTVKATSGAYGKVYIYGRLNNNVCDPGNYVNMQTQAGTLSSNQFSISGPSSLCLNTTESYLSTFIDPSITNYQWGYGGVNYQSGQGTPYLGIYVPINFTIGSIILRLGNRCGITGSPAIKMLYEGYCGYSYSTYPNPVDQTLTVSKADGGGIENANSMTTESARKEVNYDIALINDQQQIVKKGKLKKGELKLNVANLPNGIYVLHIYDPEGIVKRQILIQH